MLRVVVAASGTGSNFTAIADAVRSRELPVEMAGLVCNVPGARVIDEAEKRTVPVRVLPSRGKVSPDDRASYDRALGDTIEELGADLIVLAGYMRILCPEFIRRFPQRILNIHPSLLPAFPGLGVHEAVIDHGCKVSGCTVHYVDEGLDSGPIIAQACVPVHSDDTTEALAARVREMEHRIYPWVVEQIARGRVSVEGRRVQVDAPLPDFHSL